MRLRKNLLFCASMVALCASLAAKTPDEIKAEKLGAEAEKAYKVLAGSVDFQIIQSHYRNIAGFGSRIAGSNGERQTIQYSRSIFNQLGLKNIRTEPFRVTVPDPESEGRLTLPGGKQLAVYPMWPNLVRTSTCDVEGPLIYGGDGTLEYLNGKPIKDSIVLLEYNSMGRWKNAAKLGAKAVVFVAPKQTIRSESEQKFSTVPLNVPRFYLPLSEAGPVLNAAFRREKASLVCRQDWVSRDSCNLIAELPGSDPKAKDEPIVLFAYADSMSAVPKLAPGANSSSGLVALLELARIYNTYPHRRPITFIVSGAHHLALQGSKEFVDRRIETDKNPIMLAMTLDLSTGNRGIGGFAFGHYHDFRWETGMEMASITRSLRKHAERMVPILKAPSPRIVFSDTVNGQDDRDWRNNIPTRIANDCEPFLLAKYNAITVSTIDDDRRLIDTPFDTVDRINPVNAYRQIQSLACCLHHVTNDTSRKGETTDFRIALDVSTPQRMSIVGGFAKVEGNIFSFDPNKSFVANIPVIGALAVNLNSNKTLMGVRGDSITLVTGPKAKYRFTGLAPVNCYYKGWGADYVRPARFAAFHIDPATGNIDYGPTEGMQGSMNYPTRFELKTGYKSTPIVVFNCVATDFYDLVDPQDLKALTAFDVLDATTDAAPKDFGFFRDDKDMRYNTESEETAVMLTVPGQQFKLLMGSGLGEIRLVLANPTKKNPDGTGYRVRGLKPVDSTERQYIGAGGLFPNAPLNSAIDILTLNQQRLDKFAKYRIISKGINDMQVSAKAEIDDAKASIEKNQYVDAERHARAGWGYALRAHPIIQKTANDVVNGVIFYLFLIIPFSYFMERLLFAHRKLTHQLGWAMAIFAIAFILLYFIHPAFEIVTNPMMIFIAFVMGVLSLIVIGFILGKFEASLKALKAAQSGVHEVDIRRVSVAMAAFNLGVSNMRRRKARTFLTTLTLVVMTFIVLSFTSIVSEVQLKDVESDSPARYSGLLFRDPGLGALPIATYYQVANEFSGLGSVARRAWGRGSPRGEKGVLAIQCADRTFAARVMVGLDPSEANISRPQEALLKGGRFFKPGDKQVIILPAPVAEELKIDSREVGKATVQYAGVDYTVIGIFDPGALRGIVDLDGDEMLPSDNTLSNTLQIESRSANDAFRKFIRHDPSVCFFMPAETAISLGAEVTSVAVGLPDATKTKSALDNLMKRLRLNIYATVPNDQGGMTVHQFSAQQASKGTGILLILIQTLIAAVFVLNTMVASVHERTREISIFSAIGLAPNHIAMLFFAESLVYGVLGAVIGYFAAQATAKVIVATGILPDLYLNFSSTSAVLSATIVMATVIGSTIYPAKKASQIAAPALEGDLLDEEPEGDDWSILLPFSISSVEAAPIIRFLNDWFKAYEEYTIGTFVTSGTKYNALDSTHGEAYRVSAMAWIAPYDLGVSQNVSITAAPTPLEGVYDLTLVLTRLSGEPANWINLNKRFLADLRKQFLTWRTMDSGQREKFNQTKAAVLEPA